MQVILCLSRRKKNSQNPPKLASSLALHATAVMFAYSLRNSTSFFFLPHLHQAQADCRALRSVSLLCLHSRVRANLQQEMFLAALHRIPPCLPERGALATRAMQGVLPAHGLPLGWGRGEGADSCWLLPGPSGQRPVPPHTHAHTLLQDANLTQAEEAVSSSDMAHHFWSIWVSKYMAQAEDSCLRLCF